MKNKLHFFKIIGILLLTTVLSRCTLWTPDRMEADCPEVLSVTPNGAQAGARVTLTGKNFTADYPHLFTLTIGGEAIAIQSMPNDTTLVFQVPLGIKSGPVHVSRNNSCGGPVTSQVNFRYFYSTASSLTKFAGTVGDKTCNDCFSLPRGMDIQGAILYVADYSRHVVRQVNLSTGAINRLAGVLDSMGYYDSSVGTSAKFTNPSDVAVGAVNEIYVADEGNHCVRKINNDANKGVSTLSGDRMRPSPSNEDPALTSIANAKFIYPKGIATDKQGKVFVTEPSRNRVKYIDQNNGNVTKILTGSPLNLPTGIAFSEKRTAALGSLFLANGNSGRLLNLAINGGYRNTPDVLSNNIYSIPIDAELDSEGTLFVLDQGMKKIVVVYPDNRYNYLELTGIVTPGGVALDESNKTIYVSDEKSNVIYSIKYN
ncbi:IPT/TIG domain-containing protein [Haliscomenobacter sp.]|uniref:IPT/TIG domain-containing protein n=1 Tax=Haliscomenobacter sp. TaxID=2717303 RepID=UPI00359321E5